MSYQLNTNKEFYFQAYYQIVSWRHWKETCAWYKLELPNLKHFHFIGEFHKSDSNIMFYKWKEIKIIAFFIIEHSWTFEFPPKNVFR